MIIACDGVMFDFYQVTMNILCIRHNKALEGNGRKFVLFHPKLSLFTPLLVASLLEPFTIFGTVV